MRVRFALWAAVLSIGLCSLGAFASTWAAVVEREVEYKAGDVTLKGLLAYDEALSSTRPAVLVVHEWWGHDEHARNSARKLAKEGFVALALDMYGEGHQAHHPGDAGKMSSEVGGNMPVMKARFNAAREFLGKQQNVDPTRIAAIGYCFGGFVVLEMARAGEDLRGVVAFHGDLSTKIPAQPGKVKAEVLALNGAADPFSPPAQVEAFEKEMDAAGVQYKVVNYPGVKHSFTNPKATGNGKKFNLPLEYNAEADRESWDEAVTFLERVTRK
jgi:dienelactone hydrolase